VPLGELLYASALGIVTNEQSILAGMARDHLKELKVLVAHPGAEGIDHDFQSPTFYQEIKKHIEEYIKRRGIYK
jgi:hypothetical protein